MTKTIRNYHYCIILFLTLITVSCNKKEDPKAENSVYHRTGYIKGFISGVGSFLLVSGKEECYLKDTTNVVDFGNNQKWINFSSSIKSDFPTYNEYFELSFTLKYPDSSNSGNIINYFKEGIFDLGQLTDYAEGYYNLKFVDENKQPYISTNKGKIHIVKVENLGILRLEYNGGAILKKRAIRLIGQIEDAELKKFMYYSDYSLNSRDLRRLEFSLIFSSLENY